MASITKISMNGTMIEEKDGEIYVDGYHIKTGKGRKFDYGMTFIIGLIFGLAGFPLVLVLADFLAKVINR